MSRRTATQPAPFDFTLRLYDGTRQTYTWPGNLADLPAHLEGYREGCVQHQSEMRAMSGFGGNFARFAKGYDKTLADVDHVLASLS